MKSKFKVLPLLILVGIFTVLFLAACNQAKTPITSEEKEGTGLETLTNGDQFADLIVGVLDEDLFLSSNAGMVNFLHGTATGFSSGQSWSQSGALPGAAETGDSLGNAVATGDFDGDSNIDVAIGVQGEDVQGLNNTGMVHVLYGTSTNGLTLTNHQMWFQGDNSVKDVREEYDYFGGALAVGDFNGDNYDDLAIGAYGEDIGAESAGAVHIIYGSIDGLKAHGVFDDQLFSMSDNLLGIPGHYDRLGTALTTGDFDGNGYDDLAIGVPNRDVSTTLGSPSVRHAGEVIIIYGDIGGLDATTSQELHQDIPSVISTAAENEEFGTTLTTGDFNNDDVDDLVVHVLGQDVSGEKDAGAVHVFYGAQGVGLTVQYNQFWHKNVVGIPGDAGKNDGFGLALTAGDFDADGYDDLAIGAPSGDTDTKEDVGSVTIIRGSTNRLISIGSEQWTQDSPGIVDDAELYDEFGRALVSADFNGDGVDDIAIGVPSEDINLNFGGAINVLYGIQGYGLTATNNLILTQDDAGQVSEADDLFGLVLAASR